MGGGGASELIIWKLAEGLGQKRSALLSILSILPSIPSVIFNMLLHIYVLFFSNVTNNADLPLYPPPLAPSEHVSGPAEASGCPASGGETSAPPAAPSAHPS